MKETCERCGCTPRAPRRRCTECDKLVCVSNCWSRSRKTCTACDPVGKQKGEGDGAQRCKICATALGPLDSRCPKCFWLIS